MVFNEDEKKDDEKKDDAPGGIMQKLIESRTVMRRLGKPAEIAAAICFLACERDASYITSETIIVAGGMPASRLSPTQAGL